MGGVGWGENGRIWRSPARCWAQTSPGHARCGPLGSGPTSLPCRGIVGHCSSPPVPSGGHGYEEKGDGHQKGGSNSGWDQARRCRNRYRHTGDAHHTKHSGSNRAVAAGRVSDGAGLSVTLRGSFAAFFSPRRWTTPTFALSFILKPNTDPVTRWVEAMEEKRNTFFCRLL